MAVFTGYVMLPVTSKFAVTYTIHGELTLKLMEAVMSL